MSKITRRLFILSILLFFWLGFSYYRQAWAIPIGQPSQKQQEVRAELVSSRSVVQPGDTLWLGVKLTMAPGWHIYWSNPGSMGTPTVVQWQLPEGFVVQETGWPYPQRSELAGLSSLGYSREVLLPVKIKVPQVLPAVVEFRALVQYLGCSDICQPGEQQLSLQLPKGDSLQSDSSVGNTAINQVLFAKTQQALPQEAKDVQFTAVKRGQSLELAITSLKGRNPEPAWEFYPTLGSYVDLDKAPEVKAVSPTQTTVLVPLLPQVGGAETQLPDRCHGILVNTGKSGFAWLVDVPWSQTPLAATAHTAAVDRAEREVDSLSWAIFLAFCGGMVLNLMPCVFPVLSIKVLSLVSQAGETRATSLRHALVYALGILVSFWVVAGCLLLLRSWGQQIGWGFQLQSSFFVLIITLLFFFISLNLLGVFEVGLWATQLGGVEVKQTSASGAIWGSFVAGILATASATPCTAPFMGSAIGYSLTVPVWASLTVFTALALGMALPYVALASFPQLLRWLPRPGAWMETFKQILAFPLLLTCIYFLWVIDVQSGPETTALCLVSVLLLGIAGWIYGRWGFAPKTQVKASLSAIFLLIISLSIGWAACERYNRPTANAAEAIASETTAASSTMLPETKEWSDTALSEAIAQKRPVFIDFGAAWCLTCQLNERGPLASPRVLQAMAKRNVLLLKADWTNKDARITQALESYGRSGVPLYVYYPAGKKAQLLPAILSEALLLQTLEPAE